MTWFVLGMEMCKNGLILPSAQGMTTDFCSSKSFCGLQEGIPSLNLLQCEGAVDSLGLDEILTVQKGLEHLILGPFHLDYRNRHAYQPASPQFLEYLFSTNDEADVRDQYPEQSHADFLVEFLGLPPAASQDTKYPAV